jgi:hypothetical protein
LQVPGPSEAHLSLINSLPCNISLQAGTSKENVKDWSSEMETQIIIISLCVCISWKEGGECWGGCPVNVVYISVYLILIVTIPKATTPETERSKDDMPFHSSIMRVPDLPNRSSFIFTV